MCVRDELDSMARILHDPDHPVSQSQSQKARLGRPRSTPLFSPNWGTNWGTAQLGSEPGWDPFSYRSRVVCSSSFLGARCHVRLRTGSPAADVSRPPITAVPILILHEQSKVSSELALPLRTAYSNDGDPTSSIRPELLATQLTSALIPDRVTQERRYRDAGETAH